MSGSLLELPAELSAVWARRAPLPDACDEPGLEGRVIVDASAVRTWDLDALDRLMRRITQRGNGYYLLEVGPGGFMEDAAASYDRAAAAPRLVLLRDGVA